MKQSSYQCNNITYDVGGMGIKAIYFDSNFMLLKEYYLEYPHHQTGSQIVLLTVLETILVDFQQYPGFNNLGICFPGIVDYQNNKIISESFLIELNDIDIKQYFITKTTNLGAIVIENDAKAAAIGELYYGNSGKYQDCVLLTIGSGVGGAIIINGKIHHGQHFLAGEVSKIYANLESDNNYVLAHTSSTMALQKAYAIKKGLPLTEVNGRVIMGKASTNDPLALEVLAKITNSLARAIFNIFCIVDVNAFIIGGGISESQIFLNNLQDYVNLYFKEQNLEKFQPLLLQCKLKNAAGCYGMLWKLKEGFYEK